MPLNVGQLQEVVMFIYRFYTPQLLHTSSCNHLLASRTCPTTVVSTQRTLVLILQNIPQPVPTPFAGMQMYDEYI